MPNESGKQKFASSWKTKRADLLQQACGCVAEQLKRGVRVGRAIRLASKKFHGRCLGESRRLKLSPVLLRRLWDKSKHGRDSRAFELHHRSGAIAKPIDPFFLHLLVSYCAQGGVSLASAIRELDITRKTGVSVRTIYRNLPVKTIRDLTELARRARHAELAQKIHTEPFRLAPVFPSEKDK
jgi:hypothetical protein